MGAVVVFLLLWVVVLVLAVEVDVRMPWLPRLVVSLSEGGRR